MTDPHRRDRTRPLELLGISAVLALGIGLIALVATHHIERALIFAGVAFVLALVVLAMLMLAVGPKDVAGPENDESDDGGPTDDRKSGSPH